jgi:hypothetical protein
MFAGKAKAYLAKALLGSKGLQATNTLAFYEN